MSTSRRSTTPRRRRLPVAAVTAVALAASLAALGGLGAPASAAPGDGVIAWAEVEDGVISGGPALNSGDHGNFSGTGSYTFRETGMTSTMSVTAPVAGTYPVHVRYAAGPLSAEENVTRSMGLVTNGVRQRMELPLTGDWETWRFVTYDVALRQGVNSIALACDRGTELCRLNFDAIQVGGAAPDACAPAPTNPGYRALFDGTFATFDGWRKAGAGGFGRQVDCSIRSLRGRGATWTVQQQSAPYTLQVDWRRTAADDESSVYVASGSRGGADPSGGVRIPIGTDTGAVVPTGGTIQRADQAAVAGALRPVGSWNTYTLRVTRTSVTVLLNDVEVNAWTSPSTMPTLGHVGLENRAEGNDVSFRSIQVKQGVAPDVADSTTTLTATPGSVVAGRDAVAVAVAVAAGSRAPSGDVELYVDGVRTSVLPLTGGTTSATVGPFATAGTHYLQARYLGATTASASLSALVPVTVQPVPAAATPPATTPAPTPATAAQQATPRLRLAVRPGKPRPGRATVAVRVTGGAAVPTGTVRVKAGRKTVVVSLVAGRGTARLATGRTGALKVRATYAGDALHTAATARRTVRVTTR
jgi:hypothetical protein